MTWDTSHEFAALRLIVRGRSRCNVVRSVRDAAKMLIVDWPSADGEDYIIAVRACLEAYDRKIPAEQARAAFIRAANEERIPHFSVVR